MSKVKLGILLALGGALAFAPGGYEIAQADEFWHTRAQYSMLNI